MAKKSAQEQGSWGGAGDQPCCGIAGAGADGPGGGDTGCWRSPGGAEMRSDWDRRSWQCPSSTSLKAAPHQSLLPEVVKITEKNHCRDQCRCSRLHVIAAPQHIQFPDLCTLYKYCPWLHVASSQMQLQDHNWNKSSFKILCWKMLGKSHNLEARDRALFSLSLLRN